MPLKANPKRVRKVHLNGELPSNLSRCGKVVLLVTARRALATCRRCLVTNTVASLKAKKLERWRRHYRKHHARYLAQAKARNNREDVLARRAVWLEANRWRVYEYQAKSRAKRRRRMAREQRQLERMLELGRRGAA